MQDWLAIQINDKYDESANLNITKYCAIYEIQKQFKHSMSFNIDEGCQAMKIF